MAAPNIVNVATITGKTKGQALTTTLTTDILENRAASGKVFKLNNIIVANVDGSNAADVTIDFYDASATTSYNGAPTAGRMGTGSWPSAGVRSATPGGRIGRLCGQGGPRANGPSWRGAGSDAAGRGGSGLPPWVGAASAGPPTSAIASRATERPVAAARAVVSYLAARHARLPLVLVARQLGVSPCTIMRGARVGKQVIDERGVPVADLLAGIELAAISAS